MVYQSFLFVSAIFYENVHSFLLVWRDYIQDSKNDISSQFMKGTLTISRCIRVWLRKYTWASIERDICSRAVQEDAPLPGSIPTKMQFSEIGGLDTIERDALFNSTVHISSACWFFYTSIICLIKTKIHLNLKFNHFSEIFQSRPAPTLCMMWTFF